MSTNNFPLVWNNEVDDGLLGSLFNNEPLTQIDSFSNQDSNTYVSDSMFGKESLFYVTPAIKEIIACVINREKWIYKFYQSTKGSELISDYRKYDSFLEKSEGKSDEVYDFIVYIETDYTVNMGKVLLIKMSNAMIIDYLEKFKMNIDTPILKQWSKSIYEENKSRKGFSATIDNIEEAFLLEIQYRSKVNDGTIKLTNSEIVSIVSSQLSTKIREIKIDRENWDPTLKSDRYKLESFEKRSDYLVASLNNFKNEIANYRKLLQTINLFSTLTGKKQFLDGFIQFLKSLEIGIASIIQKLKLIKENELKYFAFFCGIIDGVIEFICGIIDVVFLILELIFSNALKDKPEFELDFLELREGLEEFIEAWLDNPNFLDKEITEMMEVYEYSRRNDPKLNKYQIAHNNGEDLVLAIDIILSFIAIVKSLTNSTKYLPKFTEWIDEVVQRNPKIANKVENAILKLAKVTYGESELSKLAITFRKTLGKNALHNGNIAVFEYIGEAGIVRKEFTTMSPEELLEARLRKSPHAEIIGMEWLKSNKISAENVKRIYSELEPCSLSESMCKDKLTNTFKNADIEYSFGYPGDETVYAELRKQAIDERQKLLKELIK